MGAHAVPEEYRKAPEDYADLTVSEFVRELANRKAAEVPLETLRNTLKLADHVKEAVEKGNVNCITDAGTAAQLVRTTVYATAYNVRINLGGIADPVFVENCRAEVSRMHQVVILFLTLNPLLYTDE